MQLSNEVFAARRARWLAELSAALGEARRLIRDIDPQGSGLEAIELGPQIDALRREVEAMRLSRIARTIEKFDPEWMNSPWRPLDPTPPKSGSGRELQVDA